MHKYNGGGESGEYEIAILWLKQTFAASVCPVLGQPDLWQINCGIASEI